MKVQPRKLTQDEVSRKDEMDLFLDWAIQNVWMLDHFSKEGRHVYIDQFAKEIRLDFDGTEDHIAVQFEIPEGVDD